MNGPGWAVSAATGEVQDLHRRSAAALAAVAAGPVIRTLRFWRPVAPAVVLGSAQPASVVAPGARVAVVRRRTGGGAVYVAPGELVWADVVIPAGDPRWSDDVTRAFWWVGEAWAAALAAAGVASGTLQVHRGPSVATEWSSLVCFGGLGPGEVTVDGRKVVGLAQRRTRRGALFQGAALLHWDPDPLLDALAIDPDARRRASADLTAFAAPAWPGAPSSAGGPVGPASPASAVEAGLEEALRAGPG